MRQTCVEVSAVEAVGPFVRMRFAAPDIAPALEPGRAILARSTETYLRRTWWPCAIEKEGFSILLDGRATFDFRIGDRLDALGPIGRGFRVDDAGRNLLLIAAGSSAPAPNLGPLLALVDRALADGRSVTLAYAAPAAGQVYPVSALSPAIEVIHAVDTDLIDLLPDAIVWADHLFACGPIDFAARLAERIESIRFPAPRGFAQVLHPFDLPCGVGACGVCRKGSQLACVDGPVFELVSRLPKSAKTSEV